MQPYLDRGEVVAVLEESCPPFPGFYLYYPARRQASPALRALTDYLLRLRQAQPPAPWGAGAERWIEERTDPPRESPVPAILSGFAVMPRRSLHTHVSRGNRACS